MQGRVELAEHHLPRDWVHGQNVGGQQQDTLPARWTQPDCCQQLSAFRVKALDGLAGVGADGCLHVAGHRDLGEQVTALSGVQSHGGAVQATAQHLVTVNDGRQRRP